MVRKQPKRWLLGLLCVGAAYGNYLPSRAKADNPSSIEHEALELDQATGMLARQGIASKSMRGATAEARLADGELFYRLKDYERAAILLTDIVENYSKHPAYPDALALLGDSLYHMGNVVGARACFEQIMNRSNESAFNAHAERAIARLLDIAVRTRDLERVRGVLDKVQLVRSGSMVGVANYYRGKYHYALTVPEAISNTIAKAGDKFTFSFQPSELESARKAFSLVEPSSSLYPQAHYFLAVLDTLDGKAVSAIQHLKVVVNVQSKSAVHSKVQVLAWLALARLYYETEQLQHALDAYARIPRNSTYYDASLFESAWVYIRMGDATRAERALELLSVATPKSRYLPDAKVLRGNLLMREGRYDESEGVFQEVKGEFSKIRDTLKAAVASYSHPTLYFQELARANVEVFEADAFIPPVARQWAEPGPQMLRAMHTSSELSDAGRMTRETKELALRLEGVITTLSPATVFGDSRARLERSTSLRNRILLLRKRILDNAAQHVGAVSILERDRQGFAPAIRDLPVKDADFDRRDRQAVQRFHKQQKELSLLEVDINGLQARIVAIESFLANSAGYRTDPTKAAAIRSELANHRNALEQYREATEGLRRAVENARTQIGVGDSRYIEDAKMREKYTKLMEQERQVLRTAAPSKASAMESLWARLKLSEERVITFERSLQEAIDQRISYMKSVLAEERGKLEQYALTFGVLKGDAQVVIGAIAEKHYNDVQGRFQDLILQSDVGRIDVAWAVREEHRMRVDGLSRERARELQAMDDEFREIEDETQPSGSGEAETAP